MNESTWEEISEELSQARGSYRTIGTIWLVAFYIAILVALVSYVLIVYIIAANRIMWTKINIIIANFAVNEAIVWLWVAAGTIPVSYFYRINAIGTNIIFNINIMFATNCVFILLALASTTVIKNKKWSLKRVFGVLYAFTPVMIVLYCLNRVYTIGFPLAGIIFVLSFCILLIVLVVKEINRCCKRRKHELARDTELRLNIVRIYVYSLVFLFLVSFIGGLLPISVFPIAFLSLILPLNGFYILMYLMKADANFKNCAKRIFKRKSRSYKIDAAIRFIDEDSVHEEVNGQPIKQ